MNNFFSSTYKFARRIFQDAMIRVFSVIFHIFIFFSFAQLLDKNDFGLLQASLNIMLFLSSLFVLGLDYRIFEKANADAVGNRDEFKSVFIFLITASVIFVSIFFIAIYFYAREYIHLASLFFSIPLTVGMSLIAEYFKGIGRTVFSQLINQFIIFSLIIIGIIYVYLSSSVYLESIITIYLTSHILAFLYATYFFRINLIHGQLSFYYLTNAIKESSIYGFMKISTTLILVLDIMIIYIFLNTTEYSNYIFGQRIGQLPSIFLTILAIHSMPKLVSLNNKKSKDFLIEYQGILNLSLVIIILSITIFFLFIETFINQYFYKYTDSLYLIKIFFVTTMVNLSTGPLGAFLTFTEIKGKVLKSSLLMYLLYFLFIITTFDYLGIYALAYAHMLTVIISNVYLGHQFFMKYEKIPFIFSFGVKR